MTVDPKIANMEREVQQLETKRKENEGLEKRVEGEISKEQLELTRADGEISRIKEKAREHQIKQDKLKIDLAREKAGVAEIGIQIANKNRDIKVEEAAAEAKRHSAESHKTI